MARIRCEMMMSVLQEVKGLIITLPRRKTSVHVKFQVHCSHGLHTYVWPAL